MRPRDEYHKFLYKVNIYPSFILPCLIYISWIGLICLMQERSKNLWYSSLEHFRNTPEKLFSCSSMSIVYLWSSQCSHTNGFDVLCVFIARGQMEQSGRNFGIFSLESAIFLCNIKDTNLPDNFNMGIKPWTSLAKRQCFTTEPPLPTFVLSNNMWRPKVMKKLIQSVFCQL